MIFKKMFTLHGITKMILYVEKGLHNGYTWRMVFGLGAVWRITSDFLIAANFGQPWLKQAPQGNSMRPQLLYK